MVRFGEFITFEHLVARWWLVDFPPTAADILVEGALGNAI